MIKRTRKNKHSLFVENAKLPGMKRVSSGHYQLTHQVTGKKYVLTKVGKEDIDSRRGERPHWNIHEQTGDSPYQHGAPFDAAQTLEQVFDLLHPRDEHGRFISTHNAYTLNPFVSEEQRRACYAANDPAWDCKEWESVTPKNIPEKAKSRVKNSKKSVGNKSFNRKPIVLKSLSIHTLMQNEVKKKVGKIVEGLLGITGTPTKNTVGNFTTAGQVLSKEVMPGYGQIWYNRSTQQAWYVGGDGDKRGFDKKVKAVLLELPSVKSVRYESEYSPKNEDGWIRAYPSDVSNSSIRAKMLTNFSTMDWETRSKILGGKVDNTFCPTGAGGGVDATCGKENQQAAKSSIEERASKIKFSGGESDVSGQDGIWGSDSEGNMAYGFTTDIGRYTIVSTAGVLGTDDPDLTGYDIVFVDPQGSTRLTGKAGVKTAREVFANVVPAIVALVKHEDPNMVTFSARGESRQSLYDRLVRTAAKVMPGYMAGYIDYGKERNYVLVKRPLKEQAEKGMRKDYRDMPLHVLVNKDMTHLEPTINTDWYFEGLTTYNAFCATGQGGGIDSSCSPNSSPEKGTWAHRYSQLTEMPTSRLAKIVAKHADRDDDHEAYAKLGRDVLLKLITLHEKNSYSKQRMTSKEYREAAKTKNSLFSRIFKGATVAAAVGGTGDNCGIGKGGFQPGNTCASKEHKGGGGEETETRANIDTPEFKAWFGDSKVVDKNGDPKENASIDGIRTQGGRPVVVYHGTPTGAFHEFKKDKIANPDQLHFGPGFYFTEDVKAAEEFARGGHSTAATGTNPTVMKFYLKSEKPFDLDKHEIDPSKLHPAEAKNVRAALVQKAYLEGGRDDAMDMGRKFDRGEVKMKYKELADAAGVGGLGVSKSKIQEHLQSLGYDSLTTKAADVGEKGKNRYWIVFEPHQVKSTANKGTFNPKDPNVLNSKNSNIVRYRCPRCGGTNAWNGDPTTGVQFRGGGQCEDCKARFSIVGLKLKPLSSPVETN